MSAMPPTEPNQSIIEKTYLVVSIWASARRIYIVAIFPLSPLLKL